MKNSIMLIVALAFLLIIYLVWMNKPTSIAEIRKTAVDGFLVTNVGGEKIAILENRKWLEVVRKNRRTGKFEHITSARTGDISGRVGVFLGLDGYDMIVNFDGGECAAYCQDVPCDDPDSCPPIPVSCQSSGNGSINTQSDFGLPGWEFTDQTADNAILINCPMPGTPETVD